MSKPRLLTTPQQRILDAFKTASKPLASGDIRVASPSYTDVVVRMLRDELQLIYIAAWRRGKNGNNGFCPLYLYGNKPDAPKPVASRAELNRRKRARVARKKAKDRAACRPLAELPAPPSIPRYNFWGI